MTTRLADRLTVLRRQRLVGREDERSLFLAALDAPVLPFFVLHVSGPGGVGKTTLVQEFGHLAEERGVSVAALDGRNLDGTPAGFRAALCQALGADAEASPAEVLAARGERQVILMDTCEVLRGLDGWLREEFLPELPDHVLVVMAAREPLGAAWRADPGWSAVVRTVHLRNLPPEEGRRYLASRRVPEEAHQAVLDFTHGHPLALSLVADVVEQRPQVAFVPEAAPDVIRALLERFVEKVPTPEHRLALEACALLRLTTESLLAEVTGVPDAHELFEWLRGLSFVEGGPYGLFPHDLAREALAADLRWRDAERYARLHERARSYYGRRLSETRGQEQQRVLWDYVYLHRDNPLFRPFLDWQDVGTCVPDAPAPGDRDALVAMVARHEGEESGRLAAYWLERQPESALVFRGARCEPVGLLFLLALERTTPADREVDPAVAGAWRHLAGAAPLRAGERATHFRYWLAEEGYQGVSPTQSLIFLKMAQHYLTTPDLAFTFLPVADAAFWAPFCDYVDLVRLPGADYRVGGRSYTVFGHDWRATPPAAWLALLAEREIASEARAPAREPAAERLLVLSREEFFVAARDALRCYTRPHALLENPLLRSRLVAQLAGAEATEGERVAVLRLLLQRAAESLRAQPRGAKLSDALHYAYFHPAPSQERAAERLHVSFSTFRRHVKRGGERVAEILWLGERGGAEELEKMEQGMNSG